MWRCHEKVEQFVPNGDKISVSANCDVLVVCGVSNWGALAVAAAAVLALGKLDDAVVFVDLCKSQRTILKAMLEAGSYDGCTGEKTESVDGMAIEKEHLDVTKRLCDVLAAHFKSQELRLDKLE
jgi:hypothetical protein